MTLENEEGQEPSLRETLEAAVQEHSDPAPVADETKPDKIRDESGKFAKSDPVIETPIVEAKPVPAAWQAKKEAFSALSPELQDQIIAREDEVHKGFTKLDEDRNLGKSMKEVITPYMAHIQAEGGTPQAAVRDLLNTAYVLRTAQPQQKAQMVAQIIQQYGVDMRLAQAPQQGQYQPPQPPAIDEQALTQKIMTQLQTEQQNAKVQSELEAFSANTQNVHFNNETVKAAMASLLRDGQAKDFQDAYDKAIWTVPEIRTSLMQSQQVELDQKKKQDIESKRKAGSSVSGSPGISVPNTGTPDRSLREEIAANMASMRS